MAHYNGLHGRQYTDYQAMSLYFLKLFCKKYVGCMYVCNICMYGCMDVYVLIVDTYTNTFMYYVQYLIDLLSIKYRYIYMHAYILHTYIHYCTYMQMNTIYNTYMQRTTAFHTCDVSKTLDTIIGRKKLLFCRINAFQFSSLHHMYALNFKICIHIVYI
jgi:hypothetical protein